MDRDAVRVLLVARTDRHTGIGSTYVYVDDAMRCTPNVARRAPVISGEPVSHEWGLRDFRVIDPEGNTITFGQPLW
jgi:hypothetical protein